MRLVFSAEKGYSCGGALGGVGGWNPGGSGADAPGAEEAVEISTVDLSIMVDVAGAGGRAVVARSAFGPAAAEFGAVGFRVDPAST